MRTIFFSIMIAFALLARAEDPKPAGGEDASKFAEHKTKHLEMLDKRIALLQEMKSCMSGAADHNAMHECREKHKEAMAPMRMEMEEMRHSNRMERMKKSGK